MSVTITLSTAIVSAAAASAATPSFAGFVQGLSAIQIPEPGMMLLFGLSVGLLGISLGRRRKD